MVNINNAFPSKYVKEPDLQGRAYVLIMHTVQLEMVGSGGREEQLPVLYFQGHAKGLVLNKTNANVIAAIYGVESDGWTGKPIELFPTHTDFQGKVVPCIRVRQPQAQPAALPTQAAPLPAQAPTLTPPGVPAASLGDPGPAGPDSYGADLDDEIPF